MARVKAEETLALACRSWIGAQLDAEAKRSLSSKHPVAAALLGIVASGLQLLLPCPATGVGAGRPGAEARPWLPPTPLAPVQRVAAEAMVLAALAGLKARLAAAHAKVAPSAVPDLPSTGSVPGGQAPAAQSAPAAAPLIDGFLEAGALELLLVCLAPEAHPSGGDTGAGSAPPQQQQQQPLSSALQAAVLSVVHIVAQHHEVSLASG